MPLHRRRPPFKRALPATTTDPSGFSGKLEGEAINNSLAFDLRDLGRFTPDMGSAITMPATSVLHCDAISGVFDNEAAASGSRMPQLNQFATITQAYPLPRIVGAETNLPVARLEFVERGQLWLLRQSGNTEDAKKCCCNSRHPVSIDFT
ncbi:hypothetical protein MB02_06350 [Croceicoccus estronivorus]|nr:hypothetical protein MB02_06350 [Croceicoccus estronivorus]